MDIASLRDFVALVRDVWQHGVFGIQISETLLALVILALFLLFRNLLTRFVLTACKRAVARTATRLDERIDSLDDSSIDILLYAFTRTTVWGKWLEIKERLAYQIKEIVEGAGAGFAFPSRSLYLETLPDAPEVFPLSRRAGAEPLRPPATPTPESSRQRRCCLHRARSRSSRPTSPLADRGRPQSRAQP